MVIGACGETCIGELSELGRFRAKPETANRPEGTAIFLPLVVRNW